MKYAGRYVAQQKAEFDKWVARVAKIKPDTYLEIGSLNGGTLLMVAKALNPAAVIISIDLAASPGLIGACANLRKRGFFVHRLTGDSTSPDMAERVNDIKGVAGVDASFIDGDHSYACVASDYELCLKLSRRGGLIGFHDIATLPQAALHVSHSVALFWKWIKENQHPGRTEEYVVELPKKRPPAGSIGSGIGVVEV